MSIVLSSFQLLHSILQDIYRVLDITDQLLDGGLVIDHLHTLCVGVVAHRKGAGNGLCKFPTQGTAQHITS